MKKLIGLFILCLLFGSMGGCKKYTDAELNIMIEQALREYRDTVGVELVKKSYAEGHREGKDFGRWENKMKLLEELDIELSGDINKILDKYRSEK